MIEWFINGGSILVTLGLDRKEMVIVRIIGGLGNQLFQYAAGRSLAYKLNTTLKLDLTSFKHYKLRSYRLSNFSFQAKLARPVEIAAIDPDRAGRLATSSGKLLRRLNPTRRRCVFRETALGRFKQELFEVTGDIYLDGYWQSEKYFTEIEDVIRREFEVKWPFDGRNRELAEQITNSNSVSLHVRRGDYLTNPQINRLHGLCGIDYYQMCVNELVSKAPNPHFFVFSDDPEWSRDNLRLSYPTTFVTHNGEDRDFEDLRLMSLCRHHIIANSTFSWWGAWLSRNPSKLVFAPRRWFTDSQLDATDLIPDDWIRI